MEMQFEQIETYKCPNKISNCEDDDVKELYIKTIKEDPDEEGCDQTNVVQNNLGDEVGGFCQDNPPFIITSVKTEPECQEELDSDSPIYVDTVVVKEEETEIKHIESENPIHGLKRVCNFVTTNMGMYSNDISDPEMFKSLSGLPSVEMFEYLFNYVEDEITEIPKVSKFDQLFSVLVKLHKNVDNCIFNNYIFPTIYVSVVDVLYKNLNILLAKVDEIDQIPEVVFIFCKTILDRHKIIIIDTLTLQITDDYCPVPEEQKVVKYLIGYTITGRIFFVSEAYLTQNLSALELAKRSEILSKLMVDDWIIFDHDVGVFDKIQVKKLLSMQLSSDLIAQSPFKHGILHKYLLDVLDRFPKHFRIFKDTFPRYMLSTNDGNCFLDKLVNVCCMLFNMLP